MNHFEEKALRAEIAILESENTRLKAERDELKEKYPRVFKVVDKGLQFMVVRCDEPYAAKVADLIHEEEERKGDWTPDCESWMLGNVLNFVGKLAGCFCHEGQNVCSVCLNHKLDKQGE